MRNSYLKFHVVDFVYKMGHGSNLDQLRNVVMIVDGDHLVMII